MLDLANYDRVVSQIYEAALVPSQWDIALTSMINLFGPREWEVAMVVWERLDPPMGRFIGTAGVHELARTAYLDFFAGRHPWSVRGHDLPLGSVVHSDQLIDRDEFRDTPFYNHFLKPWGFEVAIIGNLDRQGADHMGFVCPGPPDLDPGNLREAIERLTPHVQRAARISRRIGEADMRAAAATDLLDSSPYCVMALGPDLELLLANAQAQALLEQEDGFALLRDRIRVNDPATVQQLQAMATGRSGDRSFTFSVTGKDGGRLLLSALAISAGQRDQFANRASGAALMIIGGQRMDISDETMGALQDGFGLTAAEARLAAFLVEGSGVQGYARARGVSNEAGKYLLKSIYAKTGLSNQTELVALLREAPLGWGKPLPAL
jgi:DNA-binding CsgD family transcriptional regulator